MSRRRIAAPLALASDPSYEYSVGQFRQLVPAIEIDDVTGTIYIADQPVTSGGTAGNFIDNETPTGAINTSNTTYTLSQTPVTGSVHLYYNGVRLRLGVDFNITSSTITTTFAPTTGSNLIADYRY